MKLTSIDWYYLGSNISVIHIVSHIMQSLDTYSALLYSKNLNFVEN